MYIPGRLRTASRPSRTVMSSALYAEVPAPFFLRALSFLPAAFAKLVLPSGYMRSPDAAYRGHGSGRRRFVLKILAAYPCRRTALEVTKAPQIATKHGLSGPSGFPLLQATRAGPS